MKKTVLILLIIFTSVFGVMDTYAYDTVSHYTKILISDTKKITAGDEYYAFVDNNGNIMVPARPIVNSIGGSVYFDKNSGTIGIVYYDTYIGLSVNNYAVTIGKIENGEIANGFDYANIAKSQIVYNRAYIPLAALGMALGLREDIDYGYNSVENEIYFLNYWYDPSKIPYLDIASLNISAPGSMFKTMGKIIAENGRYYLESIEGDGARIELTNITTADDKYWENQIGAPNNDPNGMEVVITSALVEKDGAAAISLSRSISSILPNNIESKITEPYITIKIDGEVLDTTGSDPFMGIDTNGDYRTYIPFRVIAQALGFSEVAKEISSNSTAFLNSDKKFKYEQEEKTRIDTVTLSYDGKYYSFKSGVAGYYTQDKNSTVQEYIDTINGESIPAPIIRDDRMFLPVRAFATVFGCDVDWEEATKTVLITTLTQFNL